MTDGGPQVPADLLADCHARVPDPPEFEDIADFSARLNLSAAYLGAAVTAGLMTDEARMLGQDHWPADIREALERISPENADRYLPTSWHGVFQHLPDKSIQALTNKVKGHAFEALARDRINDGKLGGLPPGADHADLADDPNQPGWDLELHRAAADPIYVQAKATDHWQVIAEHTVKYPQYPDVVTTHEVARAAAQHGRDTSHLLDSGISNAQLTDHVQGTLDHLTMAHAVHEAVPEVALAAIGVAALIRLRNGEDRRDTANWAKRQAEVAGLANAAGLAVQLATGTVWLRPFAAITTRFLAAREDMSDAVAESVSHCRQSVDDLNRSCSRLGYQPWQPVA